jgi:hypothetical protein
MLERNLIISSIENLKQQSIIMDANVTIQKIVSFYSSEQY